MQIFSLGVLPATKLQAKAFETPPSMAGRKKESTNDAKEDE